MVQGEMNTALSPSSVVNTNAMTRLYENNTTTTTTTNNNHNNNTHTNNNMNGMNGSDAGGEKKKKVGNYIISKTIGEGSFAKVRLGYHLITQQMARKFFDYFDLIKQNYILNEF